MVPEIISGKSSLPFQVELLGSILIFENTRDTELTDHMITSSGIAYNDNVYDEYDYENAYDDYNEDESDYNRDESGSSSNDCEIVPGPSKSRR